MQHDPAAERYVEALFDVAEEHDELDAVASDLQDFVDLLEETGQLRLFLRSFRVPASDKVKVFRDVFEGKMNQHLLNTIALMLQHQRAESIEEVADLFAERVKAHRNIVTVQANTGTRMSENMRGQVKTSLEEALEKTVELVESVDESLQGGLRLRIGNTVYDGTIAHQLEKLREQLS
ncbi:MAG: ATP synthase subunit delta [Candidatus Marinimicrobia bacterium]|nr:ATP synthase subunit delta [Candidatus Neomarinimicrobiota bacterium]